MISYTLLKVERLGRNRRGEYDRQAGSGMILPWTVPKDFLCYLDLDRIWFSDTPKTTTGFIYQPCCLSNVLFSFEPPKYLA